MCHQAIAAEQDTKDNTIMVTATRSAETSTDIAASINNKNQDEIKLDQPVLQKELLNSISGVRITQTGSTIGHMTSIRMPTNTGPYYLFLQDSIPVQSSGFFNHNGLAYTNYETAGSTEVLKGAGTALYGSDSIAATINVLSVPAGQEQGITTKAEVGSDGFKRLGISGGIAMDNDSDLSVNYSTMNSDGWREHTAATRDEFSLQHVVDLNDENTLKTILSYNSSEAEMSGSLIGKTELLTNPTSVGDIASALTQGVDIKRNFDFMRISTELTNESLDNIVFNTIVYYRKTRNQYTATWEPNLPHNDSKTDTIGLMLKADADAGVMRYIFGLDAESTTSSKVYTQRFDYIPSGWGSSVAQGTIYDYNVDYFAIAPYLRTEFQATEKLRLAGGLRYDMNSFNYSNNTSDGQYASSSYFRPSDNNDPTFHHLSPKIDLTYALDNKQMVYARYANSFRIPQASRLYSLSTSNIAFTLNPETTDTFEIGFKRKNESFSFDVSIYHMTIQDTIIRRENSAGDRYYKNGGETLHQGVEASVSSPISPDFKIKVAASASTHKYVDDLVYGNNEQASAPKNTANIRLFYTPSQIKGLTTMLEVEHVGEWWLDDANTQTYAGYDISNLKVTYQANKKLMMYFKVNNITDKIYAESAQISYGKEKYTPAAPRQFFTGVEYNW
jgi:outer membrane receptor protein involved in Fe transport